MHGVSHEELLTIGEDGVSTLAFALCTVRKTFLHLNEQPGGQAGQAVSDGVVVGFGD